MGEMRQISITLPSEMADALRARVESGEFSSESEAVYEGLLALAERDQPVETWLRTEVLARRDAWRADPASGLSSDEIREALACNRAKR